MAKISLIARAIASIDAQIAVLSAAKISQIARAIASIDAQIAVLSAARENLVAAQVEVTPRRPHEWLQQAQRQITSRVVKQTAPGV